MTIYLCLNTKHSRYKKKQTIGIVQNGNYGGNNGNNLPNIPQMMKMPNVNMKPVELSHLIFQITSCA